VIFDLPLNQVQHFDLGGSLSAVAERVKEARAEGLRCDHPLTQGRTCVHVKGHAGHHSHTWQPGDGAWFSLRDGRQINGETGEVRGTAGLAESLIEKCRGVRQDPVSVLTNHLPGFKMPTGKLQPLPWEDLDHDSPRWGRVTWHRVTLAEAWGTNAKGWDLHLDRLRPRGCVWGSRYCCDWRRVGVT
jgi:hypothetical protein